MNIQQPYELIEPQCAIGMKHSLSVKWLCKSKSNIRKKTPANEPNKKQVLLALSGCQSAAWISSCGSDWTPGTLESPAFEKLI